MSKCRQKVDVLFAKQPSRTDVGVAADLRDDDGSRFPRLRVRREVHFSDVHLARARQSARDVTIPDVIVQRIAATHRDQVFEVEDADARKIQVERQDIARELTDVPARPRRGGEQDIASRDSFQRVRDVGLGMKRHLARRRARECAARSGTGERDGERDAANRRA